MRLREATGPQHLRAEAVAGMLGATSTVPGYRRFLRAMHGFHRAVEAGLAASGDPCVLAQWPPAANAALIGADLAAMGEVPPPGLAALDADGPGATLGVLYVVEGSSVGARMLLPAVRAIGDGAAVATRFLQAHAGDATRWRRYQALLCDTPLDADQEQALDASARAAFAAVVRHLEKERDEAARHG